MSGPRGGPNAELFKSTMLGVMTSIVRTSSIADRVDVSRVTAFVLEHWPRLFADGALDVAPLGNMLLGLGPVTRDEVAGLLLFLKSREGKLGVTVRLPVEVEAMPPEERDRLLDEATRMGMKSGVTRVGMKPVRMPAPRGPSTGAQGATSGLTQRVREILRGDRMDE